MRPNRKCVLLVILAVATYVVIRETPWLPADDPSTHRKIEPLRQKRVALHESGHAVVYAALRGAVRIKELHINDVYGLGGTLGQMTPSPEDSSMMTSFEALQQASSLLAGQASNAVIGDGPTNGASDDIKRAHELVWHMHGQYGMGRTISYYDGPLEAPPDIETLVELDLQQAYYCASLIIDTNRATVNALAFTLLETPAIKGKRTLYNRELVVFFRQHPLKLPTRPDLPWFCTPEPFTK